MTSRNRGVFLTEDTLARLLRAAVAESVTYAAEKARVPSVLAGTVEYVNVEELDVAHVRMDEEAMTGDPTQSSNYEEPGVIPTTRLGETYNDEVVRTTFDGASGAASIRTSAPNQIVLPYGTEIGQRIILDGNTGTIQFIDELDNLVGYLDPTRWFIGEQGTAQAQLDPLSGLRLRDSTDALRVQLSAPEGAVFREPVAGISGVTVNHDGILVLDPATGERISITSGTTSAVPTPHWTSSTALSPGTSHATPAGSAFGADDIDLRFCAASAAADLGAQSYTAPAGWTEQTDVNSSGDGVTLATSFATRDPAQTSPAAANFTNTSGSFTRQNGHSVIVAGGGGTSPTIRAANAGTTITSSARTITVTVGYPAGTVAGDILIAGVAIASSNVPVGWAVPDGWKQLGVQVAASGTHILGSGIWYRTAAASPPASEDVIINMSASGGVTKVQANTVGVANPYAYPGGLDIRRNNRSMPRGLVIDNPLTTNSPVWDGSADLPVTMNTITGVEHLAGRKYKIEYYCPSGVFNSLNGANQWRLAIQRDTGGGYADVQIVSRRRCAAGIDENPVYGFLNWTPTANVTANWRMNLTNLNYVGGVGYTIQFLGASTGPRNLSITDIGGEF